ncbi:MAG TPA: BlaI/MecI/CopY family transcriptional regulator [Tepidisphaeraceae bacterium]|jgi:predicted transcriptional regulator|nr:BlaI/MecI/CopY family transcriptional regulator [Tepidisphaeraceae bacterium]
MPRRPTPHPTDAELEILHALWTQGPSTLGQVYDAIRQTRPIARTTVATMLGIMLDKRLVRRTDRSTGGYAWSAAVNRSTAARGLMTKLLDSIFDGSAQRMVAHLVEQGQLSQSQLNELQQLIQKRDNAEKSDQPPRGHP